MFCFCNFFCGLKFKHVYLLLPRSHCATSALNDVCQYLSVEGGHVAVSPLSVLTSAGRGHELWSKNVQRFQIFLFFAALRYLMQQTQPEKEETPLSTLLSRMGSKYDKVLNFVTFDDLQVCLPHFLLHLGVFCGVCVWRSRGHCRKYRGKCHLYLTYL